MKGYEPYDEMLVVCNATVAFQPVFDFKEKGRVGFFEAVIRITDSDDPLFHVRLIELAEDLGFVHYLDLHVASLVVAMLRRHKSMRASVNISQRSILEDGAKILYRLASSQVCDRLTIEITETTQIQNSLVRIFAAGAREIGCKVAIDDFEMGFADEILVRTVRPDIIKVVFDDLDKQSLDRIDRAVALATELGAEVVGEKVDSEDKFRILREKGVRYVQGYAFATPIMGSELAKLYSCCLDASVAVQKCQAPCIRIDLAKTFKLLDGDRQICLVKKA